MLADPELANPKLADPKLAVPELAVPELAVPELAVPELVEGRDLDASTSSAIETHQRSFDVMSILTWPS